MNFNIILSVRYIRKKFIYIKYILRAFLNISIEYYIICSTCINIKKNEFEVHKLLPKFSQHLCNLITSACVQSDYTTYVTVLHNVNNPITHVV